MSPPLQESVSLQAPRVSLPVARLRVARPADVEVRAEVEAAAPDPSLYLAVCGGWLLCLAWFHPRLAGLLDLATTPLGWAALAFFVIFTEVAWLYAAFNVGVLAFAAIYARRHAAADLARATAATLTSWPEVAVLYTTCNDFVEASAASCLAQDYPAFTVYLLDDSADPAWRARVDAFAAGHPGRVRVIRRPDRRGFKAGNLNHALATLREPLFALADADEILPPDFLRRLAPRLMADPACGFVQAGHRCNPASRGTFARLLGPGIDTHWRWYQPLRNRYGFVMLLGHGALLRRQAWAAVGGFPELVSEDLAFALRLREHGWRGRFAGDVTCYEDFPEDMRAFRVRHMKWTRGTCEFLAKEMGRLVRSPGIPLVEKMDVLFPTLNLPLSLVFFLFILDANVLLPALFGHTRPLTLALGGHELVLPLVVLDPAFQAVMTPDFFAITVVTLLAPILCFVVDGWRSPLRLTRFLAKSTATYGTLGPLSSVGVLLYAATGKAVFHVTADRGRGADAPAARGSWFRRLRARLGELLAGSHPDRLPVQAFEVACGVGFGLTCLATAQVSFFGLSLGFVLLPVAHHVGWEHPAMRFLSYLPFAFIVLGLGLGGMTMLGLQPVLFGYGFHF